MPPAAQPQAWAWRLRRRQLLQHCRSAQLIISVDRLGRIALFIIYDVLNLLPQHAAICVDLFNCHFYAVVNRHAIDGDIAGQRSQAADFNRITRCTGIVGISTSCVLPLPQPTIAVSIMAAAKTIAKKRFFMILNPISNLDQTLAPKSSNMKSTGWPCRDGTFTYVHRVLPQETAGDPFHPA